MGSRRTEPTGPKQATGISGRPGDARRPLTWVVAASALLAMIAGAAFYAPIRSAFAQVTVSSLKKFSAAQLDALVNAERRTHLFASCWTQQLSYDEGFSDNYIATEIKSDTPVSHGSTLASLVRDGKTDKRHLAITSITYACLPGAQIDDSARNNQYSLDPDGGTWHLIGGGNG